SRPDPAGRTARPGPTPVPTETATWTTPAHPEKSEAPPMDASTPPRAAEERPGGHLLEESILPTLLNQRPISLWGFIWIWVGLAVVIVTFQYGANGVEGGISLPLVMLVVLTATMALAVIMTMTADIGTEHGLSFAVYLRAPFGTVGTHFPAVSLAVQAANVALGIKAVERLASVAAPCILAISVWMYFTLDGIAELEGTNIWTFAAEGDTSLLAFFLVNMVVWAPLAVDIPSITRFAATFPGERRFLRRNRNIIAAQFVVLPLMQAC